MKSPIEIELHDTIVAAEPAWRAVVCDDDILHGAPYLRALERAAGRAIGFRYAVVHWHGRPAAACQFQELAFGWHRAAFRIVVCGNLVVTGARR